MSALPQSAVARPSLALLGTEPFRAALEFVSHKLACNDVQRPGDGHPVLIFPGLAANGSSLAPLREHCRSDGVVAWQTCRHHQRVKQVQDIEVDSSHVGMGWNRNVLQVVQDRLLPGDGPWRRYVRAD